MSSSNHCFLTCKQVSWESGKVAWYSHLFQNFPQFVVIHIVRGFHCDQWVLAIWSLVPLPFLNPGCTSGNSQFMYCWSLAWGILSNTLLACEMSAIEHSLALPFFGIGMKTNLSQCCGHCWVFQICWHIECSTLTAPSFRIWNSSAGISLPPLALFSSSQH